MQNEKITHKKWLSHVMKAAVGKENCVHCYYWAIRIVKWALSILLFVLQLLLMSLAKHIISFPFIHCQRHFSDCLCAVYSMCFSSVSILVLILPFAKMPSQYQINKENVQKKEPKRKRKTSYSIKELCIEAELNASIRLHIISSNLYILYTKYTLYNVALGWKFIFKKQ